MTQKQRERIDIEKCVLIFDPDPHDDLVMERCEEIRDLRRRLLRTRRASKLVAICNDVCSVFCDPLKASDVVSKMVKDALIKRGDVPEQHGRELELGVCGVEAVVQSMISERSSYRSVGWSVVDLLASCLWSALSFLPTLGGTKLEAFRKRAVETARARAIAGSEAGRIRPAVPPLVPFDAASFEPTDYAAAAARTVDALKRNASVDREEIDVLRWVLRGKSGLVERPLRSLSSEVRVVASGVEIGALMRAPPARSHRDLIVPGVEGTQRLRLAQLLEELGEARRAITASFREGTIIQQAPLVFPLMSALCSREDPKGRGSEVPRSLSEWGARALIEVALLRQSNRGFDT